MKIELRMSDDTVISMEDTEDGIDMEFSRWQYEQKSDRDYINHKFVVHFKTHSDLNQFFYSLKLISKEFNNED